ncbi:hypothetical protein [Corynebacterium liangguodongii]|uniref:Uncharacterized protein n=1 Tax=Corynebacterium liangguodongii TaxID=2079535 RepID=A0A2S0WCD7_9CORY|nr:hypothetical protein [Corynebacterium liangguodongii]AWB83414.1 hypothetical protein C3E79_02005 [Corynebacterium liangguodongii]PWC00496.1 hypothetical protein DF219_00945 [Corynebacterium liangguodongii]
MNQPLHVDPEDIRQRLGAAIARYEEAISQLKAGSPEFPAGAVGAGFLDDGTRLAAALVRMQELNVSFLESRVEGWRQLQGLMDSVEHTDQSHAEGVRLP